MWTVHICLAGFIAVQTVRMCFIGLY